MLGLYMSTLFGPSLAYPVRAASHGSGHIRSQYQSAFIDMKAQSSLLTHRRVTVDTKMIGEVTMHCYWRAIKLTT